MGQFFPKTHFGHKWGQDSGQSNHKLKSIRAKYIDKQNNFVDHELIYFGNMKRPGIKVDAWGDFRLVFLSTKIIFKIEHFAGIQICVLPYNQTQEPIAVS